MHEYYERLTINIVASVMKAGIPYGAGAICGPELQLFSLQQVTFLYVVVLFVRAEKRCYAALAKIAVSKQTFMVAGVA